MKFSARSLKATYDLYCQGSVSPSMPSCVRLFTLQARCQGRQEGASALTDTGMPPHAAVPPGASLVAGMRPWANVGGEGGARTCIAYVSAGTGPCPNEHAGAQRSAASQGMPSFSSLLLARGLLLYCCRRP